MDASLHTIDGRAVLWMERRLAQPLARVWRALTEPAELSRWFPATVSLAELFVGAGVRFDFGDGTAVPGGRITVVDPPRCSSSPGATTCCGGSSGRRAVAACSCSPTPSTTGPARRARPGSVTQTAYRRSRRLTSCRRPSGRDKRRPITAPIAPQRKPRRGRLRTDSTRHIWPLNREDATAPGSVCG